MKTYGKDRLLYYSYVMLCVVDWLLVWALCAGADVINHFNGGTQTVSNTIETIERMVMIAGHCCNY